MNTERWQLAGDIFEKLLDAPAPQRRSLLVTLCGDDAELHEIVGSMLDSQESARAGGGGGVARALAALTPDDADLTDGRIGPWRLVRQLGTGGMGVVWLAERADGQFRQRAALKLIKRGMDTEAVLARFLRERQILARLDHPNIAYLLDGGIAADGRPYFAMEYVEGLPLLEYCAGARADIEIRLRLFLEVCAAVEFAHQRHVVHRDLKPSNVLVTSTGAVKLLDFGIAKLLQDDEEPIVTLTRADTGRPMTPAYAAPEQIAGEPVTALADVYALGGMLYELLTGRLAHDFSAAPDAGSVLGIIRTTDPATPSRLAQETLPVPRSRLRGDLDTIMLTALRAEPQRRYASVAALAGDVRNHLDGKPIAARRDYMPYRAHKFVKRHRSGVLAVLAVFVAVCVLLFEAFQEAPHRVAASNASYALVGIGSARPHDDYPWVGAVLGPMLANELANGGRMHRIADSLVGDATRDMAVPTASGFAAGELAELKKRLPADYFLSGSYLVSGAGADTTLRIDVVMQSGSNGESVAAAGEQGPLASLPQIVQKLAGDLRTQLGFASLSPDMKRRVAQGQPPNVEVARHIGIAIDALRHHDAAKARAELTEANILAPDYAPAYLYLADAYRQLGFDAKALAAAQQALEHSATLPPEQQLPIARAVAALNSDWTTALDIDRKIIAAAPDDAVRRLDFVADLLAASRLDEATAEMAAVRKLPEGNDATADLAEAKIARARSDFKVQAQFARRALDAARSKGELGLAGEAGRQLGIALESMGKLDEAAALYRQAAEDFSRVGNPKGEANAHADLGVLLQQQSRSAEAQAQYQLALKSYQEIGDRRGLVAIYANMARLLWTRGDLDATAAAIDKVMAYRTETGDVAGQAWAMSMLANVRRSSSAADATLDLYRRAAALSEQSGDRSQLAFVQADFSAALVLRGRLADAEAACMQSLAVAKALDAHDKEAGAALQCAAVAWEQGRRDLALAHLRAALDLAKIEGLPFVVALAQRTQARFDMEDARWSQAAANLEAAAGKFVEDGNAVDEAIAQAMLALCLAHSDRAPAATRARERAAQLRRAISLPSDALTIDVLLEQFNGESGSPDAAANRLLELADEADGRDFISIAFEARLAALPLLRKAGHVGQMAGVRAKIESAAQSGGFESILQRLRQLR